MAIGIPYAFREFDDKTGQTIAICPRCGERIREVEMKDFESASGREYAEHWAKEHANEEAPVFDADARMILNVPADCSKKSLQGWIAGIRVKLFDWPADSKMRKAFIAEAQKKIGYACFLLRTRKATVTYLKAEVEKIRELVSVEAD